EQANAIAADAFGNVYIAGTTNSLNFPVTPGAVQGSFTGVQDAFAAKVDPSGSVLLFSTYLGGGDFTSATGVATDASGNVYVSGYTSSTDFPSVGAVQPGFSGLFDGFISILNPAGTALTFSTFFGGSGSDQINDMVVDAAGNMYLGGQTGSSDL